MSPSITIVLNGSRWARLCAFERHFEAQSKRGNETNLGIRAFVFVSHFPDAWIASLFCTKFSVKALLCLGLQVDRGFVLLPGFCPKKAVIGHKIKGFLAIWPTTLGLEFSCSIVSVAQTMCDKKCHFF